MEQGKNYILVRKISDAIFGEFDVVLRRSFLFLISLAKDGLDAVQKQDKNTLNNIILMDLNLNKFTDFCRRILNKQGHPKFKRTAPLYHIIEMLEKKLGKPVPKEEIIAAAEEQGIKVQSTEDLLRRLKTEGSIFEPKINYIERIR